MTKTAAKAGAGSSDGDLFDSVPAASVLLPCNRESALLVLGSLCASDAISAETDLPIDQGRIAVVSDGLREEEAQALAAGDPRRFSVLLQFPSGAIEKTSSGTWLIPTCELQRVLFASQKEADDFRYRAVDEVNTESLDYEIKPRLFGLPGGARFSVQRTKPTRATVLADRIAAGVHYAIRLAEVHSGTRQAAIDFFSDVSGSAKGQDRPTFQSSCVSLLSPAAASDVLHHVLIAFTSGDSAAEIIKAIASTPSEDRAFRRWSEVAQGVLQSRVELSRDQLSDEGSIVLRGALLGLTAETPDAVGKFLESDRPAGPHVSMFAAFLAGLRKGVLNLSWAEKQQAPQLSRLTTAFLLKAVEKPADLSFCAAAQADPSENRRVRITVSGIQLAEWSLPELPVATTSPHIAEALEREGYQVLGMGRMPKSVLLSLSGTSVELQLPVEDGDGFCTLKVYLDPVRKIRKKSDIVEAFSAGGMLWYPGPLDAEEKFLFCDLVSLPRSPDGPVLASKLKAALDAFLTPEKQKRSPAKRAPKGRSGDPAPRLA
ncbi:hypothetical protein [Ramlibacter tataouinensis]|uniref:hypothetical protein n=1 Tax=Ramlibacter tataouinensis TaxID=94132 RepID=UPI0011AE54AF|nr:hypothetical protein [Ramlibacter tataouinensis]